MADTMNPKAMERIQAHLQRTFGNSRITLKARPKLPDSAEVFVAEEFIGLVFEDEDDKGDYRFEMPLLGDDLS